MKEKQLVPIDKISSGSGSVSKKDKPDAKDSLEENTIEISKLQAEVEALEQRNQDSEANRTLRSEYADKVFKYLLGYSATCVLLLFLVGFKIWGFSLPAAVLTVVVGSTAAAAIGLVGFVVSGLFKTHRTTRLLSIE